MVVVVLLVGSAVGAGARPSHTALRGSIPEAASRVESVPFVELTFFDAIRSVEIAVTGPDGRAVATRGAVAYADDDTVARQELAPPGAVGAYVVDYRFVAGDGEEQLGAFEFDLVAAGDSGSAGPWLVLSLVVIAGAGAVVLARRRIRNRQQGSAPSGSK